jgi:aconitate hydratase 2/2-methylisocitrate dehydratase
MSGEIYRYLNFDRMDEYQNVADTVKIPVAQAS